jgi:hypothetical protein
MNSSRLQRMLINTPGAVEVHESASLNRGVFVGWNKLKQDA